MLEILPIIRGSIELTPCVIKKSAEIANKFCGAQEGNGFTDLVDTMEPPEWLKPLEQAIKKKTKSALFDLGLAFNANAIKAREELVLTCGIGKHTDWYGYFLCFVLFNDGLKFKQGKINHVTKPGEWFIFNDKKPHEVKESKNSTAYVGWIFPLKEIEGK